MKVEGWANCLSDGGRQLIGTLRARLGHGRYDTVPGRAVIHSSSFVLEKSSPYAEFSTTNYERRRFFRDIAARIF